MLGILQRAARRSACILFIVLGACGGGGGDDPLPSLPMGAPVISQFTSDRTDYFVGAQARLTAVYESGTGRIQPGDIPIASGQTITTAPLSGAVTFHLTVTGNNGTATRAVTVTASYRDRVRPIAMPFSRGFHAAVPLNDGRVLIVGGLDESGFLGHPMYVFDPSSETFSRQGSLGFGRVGLAAATLADGSVLVTGGTNVGAVAVLINPQTGAESPTAGQPQTSRFFATATRLQDGKVLIVGGHTGLAAQSGAEIYDPANQTFTPLAASLSMARYRHSAVATVDGRVLIYGGFTDMGMASPPELFDPANGAFTVLGAPESDMRGGHSAVRTSDGNIWIAGGGADQAISALTSVIRFDATTSGFTYALDLATPRTFLAAAALTDSRVLVTGGATVNFSSIADSSELIVTSTAARRDGPSMSSPRYSHTMTLLTNEKVLIVGGLQQPTNTRPIGIASADIFE